MIGLLNYGIQLSVVGVFILLYIPFVFVIVFIVINDCMTQ